jgi:hypothetical protein
MMFQAFLWLAILAPSSLPGSLPSEDLATLAICAEFEEEFDDGIAFDDDNSSGPLVGHDKEFRLAADETEEEALLSDPFTLRSPHACCENALVRAAPRTRLLAIPQAARSPPALD